MEINCRNCKKNTEHLDKLSAILDDKMVCSICRMMNPIPKPENNYSLSKIDDLEFSKESITVKWIEWENGKYKNIHSEPAIGRSLIMDPQNANHFVWMTTEITDIIEQTDEIIVFNTKNSNYKLIINL